MKLHAIRIKDGQDLHEAIREFLKEKHITGGFIVSGVAGLKKLRLRLAGTAGDLPVLEKEGAFEVVSIDGTVSVNNVHIHIAVSDRTGAVVGGHLMSEGNIVRLTAEIGIVEDESLVFSTEMDATTGFPELVVSKHD